MARPLPLPRRTAGAVAVALLGTVCAPLTAGAAGTAFVFLTDNTPLSADMRDTITQRMGSNTAVVVYTPATAAGAQINGTPIQFGGNITRSVPGEKVAGYTVARYNVVGDLNLGSDQRIFAFGSNLLSLQVANNATLAFGSAIDLSASGRLPGAGGGAGGLAPPPPAAYTPTNDSIFTPGTGEPKSLIGLPGRSPGASGGSSVGGGYARIYDPIETFAAAAGGNGQTGMGDYRSSGGLGAAGTDPSFMFFPRSPLMPAAAGGNAAFSTATSGAAAANGGNGVAGVAGYAGGDAGGLGLGFQVFARTLRGGSGGGAGASGGHGFPGQDGGSGGSGAATLGIDCGLFCIGGQPDFARGAFGGAGGLGGYGGLGGSGGNGGAGGGGAELVVRGKLDVKGSAFSAAGADGAAGAAGAAGLAGQAGEAALAPPVSRLGQIGGRGGNGGSSGAGGAGGAGGNGSGGSGGSIQLISASLNLQPSFVNVSGGGANPVNGEFLTQSFAGPSAGYNGLDIRALVGANPYASFQSANSVFTPNIIDLKGGAEPYGVLLSQDHANQQFILAQFQGATQRVAVVERFTTDTVRWTGDFARQVAMDQIMVTAIKPMAAPALSAVSALDVATAGSQVPVGPVRLQTRGYAANPEFTAGGAGWTDLASLNASYVVLVDATTELGAAKSYQLQAAFTPYGVQRVFKGSDSSPLYVNDNGLFHANVQLQSARTAPSTLHDSSSEVPRQVLDFNNFARVGGSAKLLFTATNSGNAGSVLPGTMTVTSNQRGTLATASYTLRTPDSSIATVALAGSRGTSERIVATYTNTFDDQGTTAWSYSYDLNYVAPVPSVNLTRNGAGEFVLDFGTLTVGQTRQRQYSFANLAGANNLTDLENLNLLSYTLAGNDAAMFSIDHPLSAALLGPGGSLSRALSFTPTAAGSFVASYRVTTDANADLGTAGDVYTFRLTGLAVAAVPELAQWLMWGLGLVLLAGAKLRAAKWA